MNEFPSDIKNFIINNFNEEEQKEQVIVYLRDKYSDDLNVGKDQYIRALLILLKQDFNNISRYRKVSDPRDIIMMANEITSNMYNYFIDPLN